MWFQHYKGTNSDLPLLFLSKGGIGCFILEASSPITRCFSVSISTWDIKLEPIRARRWRSGVPRGLSRAAAAAAARIARGLLVGDSIILKILFNSRAQYFQYFVFTHVHYVLYKGLYNSVNLLGTIEL